ncbi:MAG: peptidoglycan D,D-transpeptidase FtsI family protein [Actinomycetota bacterium]
MKRPPVGRLVALFAVMALAFGAIFVRLTVLQVSRAADLRDEASSQRARTVSLPAQRGQILDRSGERLAISMPARDIYADPTYVADPWATATTLSPILGVPANPLVEQLTADTTFVFLARQVDLDVADRIADLELPGVGFLEVSKRYYPAGPLAGQVLGFVNVDGDGIAGLEFEHHDLLVGRAGERTQELDPYGQPISGGVDLFRAPVAGSSIETTIDRELQYQAQAALEAAVENQDAEGGTVIVMDPRTGDILAMASYPWFDPNAFADARPSTYRNRAVTDVFEPGSTNKVITAAAAVQEEALGIDERISVDWTMRVGEFTIHDSHPHGVQRMTLGDIIAESSNIGAVHVAERVGEIDMWAYLTRFGLGRETGVGFPGEADGITLPLSQWTDTTLATSAYGQGLAATPLQMAAVYATIANRGRWVQPRLVDATIDPDGTRHDLDPTPSHRVITAESAEMVSRMLAYAVEYGTGSNAQIDGYQIAGKTGTSRIPLKDRPGYLEGEYVASFIGFLPARDPQVLIAAILDRPAQGYGGLAAAPLFQQVARTAISRLGIEPAEPLPMPPHALPLR